MKKYYEKPEYRVIFFSQDSDVITDSSGSDEGEGQGE